VYGRMILNGMPARYAEHFAFTDQRQRPQCYSNDAWLQYKNDAGLFLDQWGKRCLDYGWGAVFLFGHHAGLYEYHARRAFGFFDLLQGDRVKLVEPNRAAIERQQQARRIIEIHYIEKQHICYEH
ncbi:MAG: hypothetical protein AB8B77_06395, partial [Alphaproteobacteria bacterium]